MAPTPGWNPEPLAPQVIIKNIAGVEQYRFESANILPAGIRNFDLRALGIHLGVNDDHGFAGLRILDWDGTLLESGNELLSKIKNQWEVQVFLGKTSAGLQRWFYGIVMESFVFPQEHVDSEQYIFCAGWGIRTADRISVMKRFQKRAANGLDLDDTDTDSKYSEIFKDIFTDADHRPYRSLAGEPEISAVPVDNPTKAADFQESFQSWAHMMVRCGGAIGGHSYVNADREAKLNTILSVDSGFLFTDDHDAQLSQNWDPERICYIKSGLALGNSSFEGGISVLHSFGPEVDEIDVNNDPATNAVFDMSTKHVAVKFTPSKSKLRGIAAKLRKTGTPANIGDAFVKIVSEESGGTPKDQDVLKRVRIPVEKLTALQTTSGTWVEIPFSKVLLDTDRKYFVILEKYGNATDHIGWEYITGVTANAYYDSDDGLTWTGQQGGQDPAFSLRTYPSRAIHFIAVDTVGLRKGRIRERIIPLRDSSSQKGAENILIGLSGVMSKERRILPPLTISAPFDRIIPGQYATITSKKGLNMRADVLSVDVFMDAYEESALGANDIQVVLEAYR